MNNILNFGVTAQEHVLHLTRGIIVNASIDWWTCFVSLHEMSVR